MATFGETKTSDQVVTSKNEQVQMYPWLWEVIDVQCSALGTVITSVAEQGQKRQKLECQ